MKTGRCIHPGSSPCTVNHSKNFRFWPFPHLVGCKAPNNCQFRPWFGPKESKGCREDQRKTQPKQGRETRDISFWMIWLMVLCQYLLVKSHYYGTSPCLLGKSSVNGNFQWLYWFTRGYLEWWSYDIPRIFFGDLDSDTTRITRIHRLVAAMGIRIRMSCQLKNLRSVVTSYAKKV